MTELAKVMAVIAVLATAVVYGTDVFCAVVLRPALAAVGDRALVEVTGQIHRYGDRRLPVPGVLGGLAAVASAALFAASGHWVQAGAATGAVLILLAWIVLYVRVSAPINRRLIEAAVRGTVPPEARALQSGWDHVINARAVLQGLALVALCATLLC